MKKRLLSAVAAALALAATGAWADANQDSLDEYREMLADGNPSELWEMSGEELWTTARGPKNASLEKCDLGMGPGVVKGAYAQMPRYFKDTGKVQDLESRLMTCMDTLQGITPDNFIKGKWGQGEMEKMEQIVAYVVGQSNGTKVKLNMGHPEMKRMYKLGEEAFFYRAGPMDFSCATCHGDDGKRIRMQGLPNITKPEGAAAGWTTWPAYRVSNGQFWTMQHRLNDCYRQQRFPEPIYGSEVTQALSVYMAAKANGAKMATPGIKR